MAFMSVSPRGKSEGEKECSGNKRPRGICVDWNTDVSNDERLLDLIDSVEPVIKKCLLMSPSGRSKSSLSKSECCRRVAMKLFPHVPHEETSLGEAVRMRVRQYPARYAGALRSIGPEASRMRCEDFPVEGEIHEKIVKSLESFPVWKRLHLYWRTSPYFNPHFMKDIGHNSPTASTSSILSTAVRSRRSSSEGHVRRNTRIHLANSSIHLEAAEKQAGHHADHQECNNHGDHDEGESDIKENSNLEDRHTDVEPDSKKANSKVKDISTPDMKTSPKNESQGTKRSRASQTEDDLDVEQSQLTASQRHEQKMAELRLEEAKINLENKKIEAEMQRSKQEFQLRMLKTVNE